MGTDQKSNTPAPDKVLTVQVHHQNLDPRTFKVPVKWIYGSSVLATSLIVISLAATFFAVKTYKMKQGSSSEMVQELESEIQDLKRAHEAAQVSANTTAATPSQSKPEKVDPNARDTKPESEAGQALDAQEGVWTGLAPHITLPPAGATSPVQLSDVKITWQGKFAQVSGIVAYREQGKGSQQGHLIVLARGRDRIFAHPDGVLNVPTSSYLFDPEHGEYFSVARFRILKTKLGPFETPQQLGQIQVYLFDLEQKLILTQSFQYGKK